MAHWLFLAIYPLERSCLPLMSAAKVEDLLVEKTSDQNNYWASDEIDRSKHDKLISD